MKTVFRKPVMLFLVICLVLSLTACAGPSEDGIQLCADAMEKLEAMSEVHLIATTKIGDAADSLEVSTVTETWISGEDWGIKSTIPGEDALWHLMYQNEPYSALETDGVCQWQTGSPEGMDVPSRLPPLDLGVFEVVSVKSQDGQKVITLSADISETEPGEYGNTAYTDVQAVFRLDDSGDLRSCDMSFCTTTALEDGSEQEIHWLVTMEYPSAAEGEVSRYLEELYQDAVQ